MRINEILYVAEQGNQYVLNNIVKFNMLIWGLKK